MSPGTGYYGLPSFSLPADTPSRAAGRAVRGKAVKIPQERDLGFQLHCQCHENLGENVRCPAPGRTVKRGKHNCDAGQREASVLCHLYFLPSKKNSFVLSSALSQSRTEAAPWWDTRAVLFCPFFPRPLPNNLHERLARGF